MFLIYKQTHDFERHSVSQFEIFFPHEMSSCWHSSGSKKIFLIWYSKFFSKNIYEYFQSPCVVVKINVKIPSRVYC